MVAWVGTFALLVTILARFSRKQNVKGLSSALITVGVIAILLTIVGAGLVFIEPNERAVVVSPYGFRAPLGYLEQPLTPGLRWIIPGERPVIYPISRQTYTMSAAQGEGQRVESDSIRARTNDGQEVFVDASIIYAIDPTKVINLHINWQNRYAEELVRPLARGIIRDAASQYGIAEIVSTKRGELEEILTSTMAAKLAENDLLLVDFVLRDLHFSEEYAAAVEQKQIAEQQALQAEFVVQTKKQEAEQARQTAQGQADAAVIAAQGDAQARVLQAEAEAKANELLAASIRDNPELISYLYVQKLAPGVQTIFIPSGNQFILPLPGSTTEIPVPVTP